MKKITIVPAMGGNYTDLDIKPGTTARDVIRQLGLADDYVLTHGNGSEAIPMDENLYETVKDGAKLYSTTEVSVAL